MTSLGPQSRTGAVRLTQLLAKPGQAWTSAVEGQGPGDTRVSLAIAFSKLMWWRLCGDVNVLSLAELSTWP